MSDMDFGDFGSAMGAEVAKESNKGGSFAREIEFLSLDASESGIAQGKNQILIRFVTDSVRRDPGAEMSKFNLPWITVGQHYTQTKPRPEYAREGSNWPAKFSGGCRADKVFARKYPQGCMFCQRGEKPSARTWALGVEREEVRDPSGSQILGYRDKTREVFDTDEQGNLIKAGKNEKGDDKYQMKTVPAWIVMNMGWKNFFGPLNQTASYYDRSNISGLLSGDWVITRSGTGNNDTSYSFIRVDEQVMDSNNPFGLPEGTKYDLANPAIITKVYPDMPDLRKIIADRVSEDYLGRWFFPGWTPPNHQPGQQQQTTGATSYMAPISQQPAVQTPSTPSTDEPPSSALDALKNRVLSNAGGSATEATPQQ